VITQLSVSVPRVNKELSPLSLKEARKQFDLVWPLGKPEVDADRCVKCCTAEIVDTVRLPKYSERTEEFDKGVKDRCQRGLLTARLSLLLML